MPIRKMCRSTGVSYSSAHFTNWHIIYLDRTSFLIKETYDKAKHTTVAAINPVSCGQTTKRLWPKGNGLGIAGKRSPDSQKPKPKDSMPFRQG